MGKKKQDVLIADGSATAKVTLWEEHIGKLSENSSYKLQNFVVREWDATKYLSMTRDSTISSIPDIGKVKEADEIEETLHQLQNAQIIGVSHFDKYKTCLRCKARVVPSSTEGVGMCSKLECIMLQKYDFCGDQMCIKLLLMANGKIESLSAYGKVVQDLADASDYGETTEEAFVTLPIIKSITYNDRNVITDFLM